eukprot:scaffold1353_cov161-Amphora_coffeaeformis.AAC.16
MYIYLTISNHSRTSKRPFSTPSRRTTTESGTEHWRAEDNEVEVVLGASNHPISTIILGAPRKQGQAELSKNEDR